MNHTTTQPFSDLFSFAAKATAWLNKDKHNVHTKLGYALSRMVARVQKALEKAQRAHDNELEKLRIKHCKVDEKGTVLINPTNQGYEYDRGELMKLREEQEKLLEKLLDTQIEIEPYFCQDIPEVLFNYQLAFKANTDMLTGAEVEAFSGLVLEAPADPLQIEPEKAVASVS